jgi:hypothetical protein
LLSLSASFHCMHSEWLAHSPASLEQVLLSTQSCSCARQSPRAEDFSRWVPVRRGKFRGARKRTLLIARLMYRQSRTLERVRCNVHHALAHSVFGGPIGRRFEGPKQRGKAQGQHAPARPSVRSLSCSQRLTGAIEHPGGSELAADWIQLFLSTSGLVHS